MYMHTIQGGYKELNQYLEDTKLTHLCHASCSQGMMYKHGITYVFNGYLYNIWIASPNWSGFNIDFHKKLKIYYNENHGFFVLSTGKRFYINSLKQEFKEEFYEIQNS